MVGSECVCVYIYTHFFFGYWGFQDYGINKHVSKKKQNNADSKLAPPLAELMKMLFNVETYRLYNNIILLCYLIRMGKILTLMLRRAAMMEFEINLSEMPLGKLSKSNIQRGNYQNNSYSCSQQYET